MTLILSLGHWRATDKLRPWFTAGTRLPGPKKECNRKTISRVHIIHWSTAYQRFLTGRPQFQLFKKSNGKIDSDFGRFYFLWLGKRHVSIGLRRSSSRCCKKIGKRRRFSQQWYSKAKKNAWKINHGNPQNDFCIQCSPEIIDKRETCRT